MQWQDALFRVVPLAVGLIAGVLINAGLLDADVCRLVAGQLAVPHKAGLLLSFGG